MSLRFDTEFDDLLLGVANMKVSPKDNTEVSCEDTLKRHKISIDFSDGGYMGITVASSKLGVVVIDLKLRDKAYTHGIRKLDTILFVDDVSISDHRECVRMIEEAKTKRKRINFFMLQEK